MEELRVRFGFDSCFGVDREGRSGRIGVLWQYSNICTIRSFSINHIDLEILDDDKGHRRLTGFYGCPERHRRRYSWHLLRTLSAGSSLPGCCVGDYNDILSEDDKFGQADHPN